MASPACSFDMRPAFWAISSPNALGKIQQFEQVRLEFLAPRLHQTSVPAKSFFFTAHVFQQRTHGPGHFLPGIGIPLRHDKAELFFSQAPFRTGTTDQIIPACPVKW